MEDIVRDYIENEINYINAREDCTSLDKYDIRDLYMLENINEKKIEEIATNVYNDLEDEINELIHNYLYCWQRKLFMLWLLGGVM